MPAAFVHGEFQAGSKLPREQDLASKLMMLASGELSRAPVTRDGNHRGDLS